MSQKTQKNIIRWYFHEKRIFQQNTEVTLPSPSTLKKSFRIIHFWRKQKKLQKYCNKSSVRKKLSLPKMELSLFFSILELDLW